MLAGKMRSLIQLNINADASKRLWACIALLPLSKASEMKGGVHVHVNL